MRVELELLIRATPGDVFAALTEQIGSWWTYTFYPSSMVQLEPRVGGEFRERWDGGAIVYARVTRLKPGVLLALAGPMGMDGRVEGSISFTLVAAPGGTVLALTHAAAGDLPERCEEQYRSGWETLLIDGLKPFVERAARSVDTPATHHPIERPG